MVPLRWKKYRDRIGGKQKTLRTWWKTRVACPIQKINDYVKHMRTEHNQETDHMANFRAKEVSTVTVEGFKAATDWEAVWGYWDGSRKPCSSTGCAV